MSQADNHDTRLEEARASTMNYVRRMSPDDLAQRLLTAHEATELAEVAALALAGDPDAAMMRLETVQVFYLHNLHAAVIGLIAKEQESHALFNVGGAGSVH